MNKNIVFTLIGFICLQVGLINAMKQKSKSEQEQYEAFSKANIQELNNLIKAGANVNVKDNNGNTPLHVAAGYRRVDATEALIKAGANVNVKDSNGNTPLRVAVNEISSMHNVTAVDQLVKVVKILIAAGADVNAATTLTTAARSGNVEIVKALVAAGANVNALGKSNYDFKTKSPLQDATRGLIESLKPGIFFTPAKLNKLKRNHLETIKILLDAGADMNVGSPGETPLDEVLKLDPKNRGVISLFVLNVSPQEIQHVIPAIIALTKRPSNIGKDIGGIIAAQLIPEIVSKKLDFAKKYLPGESENQLRQQIIQNINRAIAKSPRIQATGQQFIGSPTQPMTHEELFGTFETEKSSE